MARIEIPQSLVDEITTYVKDYLDASGDDYPDALIGLAIKQAVNKYVNIRSFPTSWLEGDDHKALDDTVEYFEQNTADVAMRIPAVLGRMGTEGEVVHIENTANMHFASADPMHGFFPDVVPIARCL